MNFSLHFYRPHPKDGQGNVFTLSTMGGEVPHLHLILLIILKLSHVLSVGTPSQSHNTFTGPLMDVLSGTPSSSHNISAGLIYSPEGTIMTAPGLRLGSGVPVSDGGGTPVLGKFLPSQDRTGVSLLSQDRTRVPS